MKVSQVLRILSSMSETTEEAIKRAAVFVERIVIRNFRGISKLELDLEPGLTLLVGRNNSGKSRILRALHVAVGDVPVERDDLTVGSSTPAVIDIVIAPVPDETADGEKFGQAEGQRLGGGISLLPGEAEPERFAWRTTITAVAEGRGARSERFVLSYSNEERDWAFVPQASRLSQDQRNLFDARLVDAQRDLDSELRSPGSPIRKILSDLDVPEDERTELEGQLVALGQSIGEQSGTLQELRGSLGLLERYLDSVGEAAVDAVPRNLEELARTVGVSFDSDQGLLAARLHGAGVRSLASLQVQNVFYRRHLGRDGPDLRPHTVTLVEEPEAHLHPHAVFELHRLLTEEGRQVVATTHSAQLATVVDHVALRLVQHSPSSTHQVVDFKPVDEETESTPRARRASLNLAEMEKLKRLAERPFGDLLFAKAIVIGDGATERSFLPTVLSEALGHGISVVDSLGMQANITRPVINFARLIRVPVLIWADGDEAGERRVSDLAERMGLELDRDVVWVQSPSESESNSGRSRDAAMERMLVEFDLEMCRRACQVLGLEADDETAVWNSLKGNKGVTGAVLATEFLKAHPYKLDVEWPEPLRELVDRLRSLAEA